jgi:sugar phosphate isomerase/epimerase
MFLAHMPRAISISSVAYDGFPLSVAIEEIAGLGLPLIEPAYIRGYMVFEEADFEEPATEALARQLRQSGLSSIAVSAHMDQGHPDAAAMLARRMRHTAGIGARFTITNATTTDKRDALMRVLDANLKLAEDLDVIIALENPGHGSTNLMRDGASGAALIRGIGHPRIRMNYDTSNALTCTEGDMRPETDILAALPETAHLHLKDARAEDGRWSYAALGEGDVDYAPLIAALKTRPELPITVELPLRLLRRFGQDPIRSETVMPLEHINAAILRSRAMLDSIA